MKDATANKAMDFDPTTCSFELLDFVSANLTNPLYRKFLREILHARLCALLIPEASLEDWSLTIPY